MTSSHDFMTSSQDQANHAGTWNVLPVARLEKNSYFGEAALVEDDDQAVRSACVRAVTDLEVYLLSRSGLHECMAAHPSIKSIFSTVKEAKEEENRQEAEVRKRQVAQISRSFFMQICGNCATITARPNYVLQFAGGDAILAAALQSTIASSGSVLEFLFGPCFGRLSDKYGRLPFLMIGPIGSFICDGMVCAYPSKATVVIGKVISGMTVTAFITISRGALADVVQGEAMAVANSAMAMYSGVGIIAGPWLAARFLTDRLSYGASAAFALANGAMLMSGFVETLAKSERKEVDYLACNPFTFLKLFTHSKTMTMLVLAVGAQSLGAI